MSKTDVGLSVLPDGWGWRKSVALSRVHFLPDATNMLTLANSLPLSD